MTKSQINKLGKSIRKKLRDNSEISERELVSLQDYRTSYKEDLSEIFDQISQISKSTRKDSIVSFRIKRIESILSKIRREPTMSLGNMGDIAGARIILYSEPALKTLVKRIRTKFNVKPNFNDYTAIPKEDGYRGYHMYIESPINPHKTIEIQFRTIDTHKWASLVEIIDILLDLKLKEGQKHPDLQKFLKLLSLNKENLTIEERKSIIDIDKKYNIYSQLNEVFLKNHITIRKSWIKLSEQLDNNYFIIEVDAEKKSDIISINDYQQAENKYFEMFRTNKNSNFVLTFIERPDFNRICIAYASYMMIKHDYLDDWNTFARKILEFDSKNSERESLLLYGDYFKRNMDDQHQLIESEIEVIQQHIDSDKTNINGHHSFGLSEWIEELNTRNRKISLFMAEIKQLSKVRKEGFWKKIFG